MKKFLIFAIFLIMSSFAFAQEITTASVFFKSVSDFYATIKDYESDIYIKTKDDEMQGRLSFKFPELLRIDFTEPEDQVILFDGDDLTIYLPEESAILEQGVQSSKANVTSNLGLGLFRRYYTIAYENGQDPVPLEEGSDIMVVNLILYRRAATEAFSTIKLSIGASDNLIYRVEATTPKNETYTFKLSNYVLNSNISDSRFIYDPPSDANNYNNFLFAE